MTEIGFVGLGRMGGPMARHLVEAGHRVVGVDPAPAARVRAARLGIVATDQIADIFSAPVIMSSLPDTAQVKEVYLGGLLDNLGAGSLCLDLSTIDVAASRAIAADAAERGISFLDCPVGGTSMHAASRTLAIMIGGDPEALDRSRPYLEPLSSSIYHLGPNGAGLEMKLIANRLLTTHLVAIAEAIVEIESAGLDIDISLDSLRAGAVPRLLDYKAEPMSRRDYRPSFTVDLMCKDLDLAATRRPAGAVTALAVEAMRRARDQGHGPDDVGSVIEVV